MGFNMSVLDDILNDFFEKLKYDDQIPNEITDSIKDLIETDNFSSKNLLELLEDSELNGFED